ncbi:hypothetical protein D3C87_665750 [compost metagenome]
MGQGAAETHVTQPGRLHRIDEGLALGVLAVVDVELEVREAPVGAAVDDREVLLLLQRLHQGVVLAAQPLGVSLAGLELQERRVDILEERHVEAIEVRQGLVLLVDPPVVGVALEDHALGRHVGLVDPGTVRDDLGDVGVQRPGLVELGRAGLIGLGDGRRQGMLGKDGHAANQPQKGLEGLGRGDLDGPVVDLLHGGKLAVDLDGVAGIGRDLVVGNDVVEGEDDVVGGQGLAVRPLEALAELEGIGLLVLAHRPGRGQGRLDLEGEGMLLDESLEGVGDEAGRGRIGHQGRVEGLGILVGRQVNGPAVLADGTRLDLGLGGGDGRNRSLSALGGGGFGLPAGAAGDEGRAQKGGAE